MPPRASLTGSGETAGQRAQQGKRVKGELHIYGVEVFLSFTKDFAIPHEHSQTKKTSLFSILYFEQKRQTLFFNFTFFSFTTLSKSSHVRVTMYGRAGESWVIKI